eukprot:7067-Heterococcus_DN1.PRE.5
MREKIIDEVSNGRSDPEVLLAAAPYCYCWCSLRNGITVTERENSFRPMYHRASRQHHISMDALITIYLEAKQSLPGVLARVSEWLASHKQLQQCKAEAAEQARQLADCRAQLQVKDTQLQLKEKQLQAKEKQLQ